MEYQDMLDILDRVAYGLSDSSDSDARPRNEEEQGCYKVLVIVLLILMLAVLIKRHLQPMSLEAG